MSKICKLVTEDDTYLISKEESKRIGDMIAYDIDTGKLPEFAVKDIKKLFFKDISGTLHSIDPYEILSCTQLNRYA